MSSIIKPPVARLRRDHPLARGLVCATFFSEGSGTRANEVSGYDRHGTINGAGWLKTSRGWALDFAGGSANRVELGTFSVLGEITLLATVWWDSFNIGRDDRIISKGDGVSVVNHDFMIGKTVNGSNQPVFRARFGRSLNNLTNIGTAILNAGQWYQAAATFADSDQMSQLYLNGAPEGSPFSHASGSAALPNNTNLVYIGNQPTSTSNAPDAQIERALIWQRRLSAAEIKELYLDPNTLFAAPKKYFIFKTAGGGTTTVGNSRALSYDIHAGVGNARGVSYDVLGAAGNSRSLSYNISGAIGNSRTLTFDLLAGVGNSRAISFDLRTGVGNSRAVSFDLLGAIGNQRSVSYDVLALAGGSRALSFNIHSLAGGSRSLSYDIFGLAGNTRTLSFDIESALTTVGNSRSLSFNIFASIASSRAISFNIQAAIGNARTVSYDVFGRVAGAGALSFDIRSLAGSNRALSYDLRALAGSTRSISFDVESEIVPYIAGLLEKPLGAAFRRAAFGAEFRPQTFGAEFQEQNFGAEFDR